MANAEDLIKGRIVILSISTNLTTPAYKDIVCLIDKGITGSADVNTQDTSCGVAKARGNANRTVTASFAANTAPATGEMSADDLDTIFTAGTDFLWKLDDGTDYYRQGQGFLSSYNETANVGANVLGDLTIEVVGAVDNSR